MSAVKTADLVDEHDEAVRFCDLRMRLYGRQRAFHGAIETVKCFEDNSLLRQCLEQPGVGRVLVVDGGGSSRVALIGDMIAEIGRKSGWSGIVLNGSIRDVAEIDAMDFAIYALGSSPKKSCKTGHGTVGGLVSFGNVDFRSDNFVYADEDGVLVSCSRLHP